MLDIKPWHTVMDGTLGGAGHGLRIAERLLPREGGVFVGVDRDGDAIDAALTVLRGYGDLARIVRANFAEADYICEQARVTGFDGILLDLGVSSFQLDEPMRGFSYNSDAPLDMRMDRRQRLSARDVVNKYGEKDLARIITDYSDERWAARIAAFIVNERSVRPIETTRQLGAVILKAIPKAARADGPHPAKRTFQAIRIEVNDELDNLEKALRALTSKLNRGGRICVITFHSIEDKITKNVFRELENPCVCPPDLPVCGCGRVPCLEVLTRKPILPDEDELNANHRSRSAKLRVAKKL
jgi:16S rRNA (cytosine1402-N4)-methyltransferase